MDDRPAPPRQRRFRVTQLFVGPVPSEVRLYAPGQVILCVLYADGQPANYPYWPKHIAPVIEAVRDAIASQQTHWYAERDDAQATFDPAGDDAIPDRILQAIRDRQVVAAKT